jgi:hypothetical protein
MEDIQVKTLRVSEETIRTSPESRLGEELPLQYLETTDPNGQLLDSYLEGDPIGIFHDGSLAAIFRIEAPDTYYLSPEKMEELLNGLEALLSTQQRDHNLHFFWTTSDLDNETLSEFLGQNEIAGQHPAQKFLRREQATRERARLLSGELKAYKAYVLISIAYPGRKGHSKKADPTKERPSVISSVTEMISSSLETVFSELLSLGALLSNPGEFKAEEETMRKNIRKIVERKRLLQESFQQIPGIQAFDVSAGEFLSLYKRSWAPKSWESIKEKNGDLFATPKRPLRTGLANHYATDQILDKGTSWQTEGYHHCLLTLRQLPSYSDVGVMLSSIVLGRGKEIHQLEYSFILRPTDGRAELALLSRNLRIFNKQYETDPGRYPGHPQQIRALQSQIEKLLKNEGTPGFYATLLIHIWNKNAAELESWKNIIFQNYARPPLAARFGEEQYHALPFYTNKCQPGYTTDKDTSRDHSLLPREAATFLPLLSGGSSFLQESKQDRRIIALLETELGTLQPLDWFARGRVSNFGGVGVGTSGSGKSYFYNRVIAGTASAKDNVIVIDGAVANGSYRNNALVLAGEACYIETQKTRNDTHCINVLETEEISGHMRPPSNEELQRMTKNIEPMLRENSEKPLPNSDRVLLTNAIRMAFESPRNEKGHVYLRDVAASLKTNFGGREASQKQRASLLGQSLEDSWCYPNGTYKQYFDGPSSPIPEGLVIFDNAGIKDDPLLRGVLVAAQFAHIDRVVTRNIQRHSSEQKRIHVYIDEAWKALRDPVTSEFITGLYRAGRARNISPHLITQKMADLRELLKFSDPVHGGTSLNMESNEILGNCSWFNLFKHDPADALVTQEVLKLSERQTEALQSLGGISGEYREMIQYAIMQNGRFFSKLRYRPTPLEFPLFTSDSSELATMNSITTKLSIELGWDKPENAAKSRTETIARLDAAGFKQMNAYSNAQLMRLLVSWEFTLQKQRASAKGNPINH